MTKRLVTLSLLLALSVLLHFVEGLIPPIVPIPGYRIGLSNIILLFSLYYYDLKSYSFLLVCKVFLVALISSGFSVQFFLSLSGSILSFTATIITYYLIKGSIYSISTVSALSYTLGQLIAYAIIFDTFPIFMYIIIIGPLSMISGIIMAILTAYLLKRLPDNFKSDEKNRRN